ncbi:MAG TPA: hypothetical protein VMN39_04895 [Longimicrobiaceae bacterium]|nr:hypothetical protein [Longimicrobiaceae bacterium]
MTRSATRLALAGLVFLLLAACRPGPDIPPAVEEWLACNHCEGRLDPVVAMGDTAVASLSEVLLRGISDERTSGYEHRAGAEWRLGRQRMDSTAYVGFRMDNLISQFQIRSAIGLARLEAWDTLRMALDRSADLGYRADVIRTLDGLLFSGATGHLRSDGVIGATFRTGTGQPVGGVMVRLRRCQTAPAAASSTTQGECSTYAGLQALNAISDSSGRVVFPNRLEGVYELAAQPLPASGLTPDPPAVLYRLLGAGATVNAGIRMVPAP